MYRLLLASPLADDVSLCICPDRVPGHMEVACSDPRRRIVCATVSARAGPALHLQRFDAVFVDEAAQCLEAHAWTLLRPEVRLLVMAGDTHQLPPVVSEGGREAGLDRSLLQRLLDAGYPHEFLATQHRMHPEIARFPSARFYDGRLGDAPHTRERALPEGLAPYACTRVETGKEEPLGTSLFNAAEVDACARLVSLYREHYAARDIVIVAPYRAQCRKLLARGLGVAVHTVDSFQGHEAEVVLLTVVREVRPGFWDDYRRLNVALTRARRVLHVVGSFTWAEGPLGDLARDACARGLLPPS
jgi:superfamily I DNA and/or RNA helicase